MTLHLITCRCGYRAWKPTPNYRHECIVRPQLSAAEAEIIRKAAEKAFPPECVHLGQPTGDKAESKACRTSTRVVPIWTCDLHEHCTVVSNTQKPKLQSCLTCKDLEYAGN